MSQHNNLFEFDILIPFFNILKAIKTNVDQNSNKVFPDLSKLKSLNGTNYHWWSHKLLIFFEQLEVDYVLTIDLWYDPTVTILTPTSDLESSISPLSIDQLKQVSIVEPKKYTKDNKTVHLLLLNHMSYPMFDLFVAQKSAKAAGSTLESRYGGDDAGRKKYVLGKWLQFQMTNNKPIVE